MERNWAGNFAYRAPDAASAGHRRGGAGAGGRRPADPRARHAPLVQRDRRLRRAGVARGAPGRRRRGPRGGHGLVLGRHDLRRARRRARPRGPGAARTSPRSRTSRWRARSPRPPTARATRNGNLATAVAALELVTSGGERVTVCARRRRLRGPRRLARRARGGDADRRSTSSRPTTSARASSRGWRGTRCSRPRRDLRERLRRQRVHALGRVRGPGVAQEPRRPITSRATSSSARSRRPSTAIRSSATTPRTRRRSSASRPVVGAPGPLPPELHAEQRRGDPVRVPRPARARGRGDRGAARRRRSHPRDRCCGRASCARSPPTGCG